MFLDFTYGFTQYTHQGKFKYLMVPCKGNQERKSIMFNKVCLYISGAGCFYSLFMLIAMTYLTRIGFYNAKHGLTLIVLAIIGAVCCGVAAVMFENRIKSKRR